MPAGGGTSLRGCAKQKKGKKRTEGPNHNPKGGRTFFEKGAKKKSGAKICKIKKGNKKNINRGTGRKTITTCWQTKPKPRQNNKGGETGGGKRDGSGEGGNSMLVGVKKKSK